MAVAPTGGKGPTMLTEWMQDLADALGVDLASVGDAELVDLILDLARDAAHAVDRPAAPLTTFLVGYAAAQHGGGRACLAESAAAARDLAAAWERRSSTDRPGDEPPDGHRTAGGIAES
ncbi:DUF6457 domain-containing protein [Actinopolymorpha sp. B11F2]|uniref:DUF6457 domain-containing protein n=1 Tax=Actinopolymorpha sp. B11F2 TaxID=3160862 RepID=UPI0032E4AD43